MEPITPRPPHRVIPVMWQSWRGLTFLHWAYEPAVVRPLIPAGLELDLYDGAAWIGLVPFIVKLPPFWTFPETNVRTYTIDRRGCRGTMFFSLDAARLLAVIGARIGYALPYYWSRMRVERLGTVRYRSVRRHGPPAASEIEIEPGQPILEPSERDHFLTARFRLHTTRAGRIVEAPVEHPPWPLQAANVRRLEQTLVQAAGLPPPVGDPIAHFAGRVDVRIGAPRFV